jgi:hypothetical protein
MDPVALALLFAFVVLWVARGVGLLREWLEIRRARSGLVDGTLVFIQASRPRWVHRGGAWYIDSPSGNDENGRMLN